MADGVSDYYPPSHIGGGVPIVFQNEFAYSNAYLRGKSDRGKEAFILDQSRFERYCKVCKMGTDKIRLENYDKIWVVGRYDYIPENVIPPNFRLVRREEGLSWFDKVQFKYLTPIYSGWCAVSEYQKLEGNR